MTEIIGTAATSPSTITLTTLRDRIEALLVDSTNQRFSTAMLDEAIRIVLAAYTQATPNTALTSITLTTAGRETSIASLTYTHVLRVWWDYDSTDPGHPPRWRSFEVWPGHILYINDDDEPGAGDVVRVWYAKAHTLNGLDSETETTFLAHHASFLVTGAAGYAAQSRAIDRTKKLNVDGWQHRQLNDWGQALVKDFEKALRHIARQIAARTSGTIPAPTLDRWEDGGW